MFGTIYIQLLAPSCLCPCSQHWGATHRSLQNTMIARPPHKRGPLPNSEQLHRRILPGSLGCPSFGSCHMESGGELAQPNSHRRGCGLGHRRHLPFCRVTAGSGMWERRLREAKGLVCRPRPETHQMCRVTYSKLKWGRP